MGMATIVHEPVAVLVMAPHERALGLCDFGSSGLACQRALTDPDRRDARFWVKHNQYQRACCPPCLPDAIEEVSGRAVP